MPRAILSSCLLLLALLPALPAAATLPLKRNVAYGGHEAQRFDVYAPPQAKGAPVILMVHGGGWRMGDKDMRPVIENKLERWLPKGFVVISSNYRLLPLADPLEQARDVARALAAAQQQAATWGGERSKFILIGHSAGAHLLALLAARPELLAEQGATPMLGSILLDSGALDVPAIMARRHLPLYDAAFGSNVAYWESVSPYHQLKRRMPPLLAVCAEPRRDACTEARRFVDKASGLGTRAALLGQPLSHGDINRLLGTESEYTTAVEAFMRSLDSRVAQALR